MILHCGPLASTYTKSGGQWTKYSLLSVYSSVFYRWPALLTFGFSGNPALLLLVLNCHECCLFEVKAVKIDPRDIGDSNRTTQL